MNIDTKIFIKILANRIQHWASLMTVVENPLASAGDRVRVLRQEDPLEKEMATHSSILAWRIPGTEEPSGLPPMGSHRVDHN